MMAPMSPHHPDLFADADDRRTLEQMLDIQRAELADLLDRVEESEARERLVPSLTTVLGLLKHAAFVERVWFAHRVQGRTRAEVGLPETVDESYLLTGTDTIASVRADFLAACAESRRIAAQHELGETFAWKVGPISLRFIHLHLIQEYARHAGHGDILVEQLTARRGAGGPTQSGPGH